MVSHFDTSSYISGPALHPTLERHDTHRGPIGPNRLTAEGKASCEALCRRLKCDRKDKGRGEITIFVWERDDVATKIRKAFLELKKNVKGLVAHLDVMNMLTTTRDQLDVLLRAVPDIGKISARALRFLHSVVEAMDQHRAPVVSFEDLLVVLDRAVPGEWATLTAENQHLNGNAEDVAQGQPFQPEIDT